MTLEIKKSRPKRTGLVSHFLGHQNPSPMRYLPGKAVQAGRYLIGAIPATSGAAPQSQCARSLVAKNRP